MRGDFERAAAAIALAGSAGAESLPPVLRARLEEQAQRVFRLRRGGRQRCRRRGTGCRTRGQGGRVEGPDSLRRRRSACCRACASRAQRHRRMVGRRRLSGARGVRLAARAAPHRGARGEHAAGALPGLGPPAAPPAQLPAPPPTPAEERAALLARPDSLKITLGATKDPGAAGMSGDVVWNPVTQQGFLRFVGLRPNDPHMHQYQLWIFDGARDQRYPVDGGVFDVPANQGEVVVPIRAALPVARRKPLPSPSRSRAAWSFQGVSTSWHSDRRAELEYTSHGTPRRRRSAILKQWPACAPSGTAASTDRSRFRSVACLPIAGTAADRWVPPCRRSA